MSKLVIKLVVSKDSYPGLYADLSSAHPRKRSERVRYLAGLGLLAEHVGVSLPPLDQHRPSSGDEDAHLENPVRERNRAKLLEQGF